MFWTFRAGRRCRSDRLEMLEDRLLLATYTVDRIGSVVDGNLGPGQRTLPEAILEANGNPGRDTIAFAKFSIPGFLVDPMPAISEDLDIVGPGADVLGFTGNTAGSLFVINLGVTVEISGLRIQGSFGPDAGQGGAIHNSGDLTLRGMEVRGGALEGGGVYSSGTLTVRSSLFPGSSSNGRGGGIFIASGTASIENTTIAIGYSRADGAGLYVDSGTVRITNSTLAGNQAGLSFNGIDTFFKGGGIFINNDNGADVTLVNSIVAGNLGRPADIAGTLNSLSAFNIIGDADSSGGLIHGVNNNIVGNAGSGIIDIAAVLVPELSKNGGPTRTFALIPGGPAINAGNNALAVGANGPLTTDQRGFGRFSGAIVDIGAFEYAPIADVAGFNRSSARWFLGITTGDGFEATTNLRWDSSYTWEPVAGDWNGDGLMDVAGRQRETGNWFAGFSDGNKLTSASFGRWGTDAALGWRHVQVGDFNNDGRDDLLGLDNRGFWWAGLSTGTAFTMQSLGRWTPDGWTVVRVGDFDGDGFRDDVIGFRADSGTWHGAFSNGVRFESRYLGGWDKTAGWHNFLFADVTGDGASDLMAQTGSGHWFAATIPLGGRMRTFSAGPTANDDSRGRPALGDFNGDGKADLSYFASNGRIWVKLATGTGFLAPAFWNRQFNTPMTATFAADMNGDGRDDHIAYVTAFPYSFRVGVSTDSPSFVSFGTFNSLRFDDIFLGEFGA